MEEEYEPFSLQVAAAETKAQGVLGEELWRMAEWGEMVDVCFVFSEGRGDAVSVRAHSIMVCAASDVLKTMVGQATQGTVIMAGGPEEMERFKDLLRVIYCGDSALTEENVFQVALDGHRWVCEARLKDTWMNFIRRTLRHNPERALLVLAETMLDYQHTLPEEVALVDDALTFFAADLVAAGMVGGMSRSLAERWLNRPEVQQALGKGLMKTASEQWCERNQELLEVPRLALAPFVPDLLGEVFFGFSEQTKVPLCGKLKAMCALDRWVLTLEELEDGIGLQVRDALHPLEACALRSERLLCRGTSILAAGGGDDSGKTCWVAVNGLLGQRGPNASGRHCAWPRLLEPSSPDQSVRNTLGSIPVALSQGTVSVFHLLPGGQLSHDPLLEIQGTITSSLIHSMTAAGYNLGVVRHLSGFTGLELSIYDVRDPSGKAWYVRTHEDVPTFLGHPPSLLSENTVLACGGESPTSQIKVERFCASPDGSRRWVDRTLRLEMQDVQAAGLVDDNRLLLIFRDRALVLNTRGGEVVQEIAVDQRFPCWACKLLTVVAQRFVVLEALGRIFVLDLESGASWLVCDKRLQPIGLGAKTSGSEKLLAVQSGEGELEVYIGMSALRAGQSSQQKHA